MTAATRVLGKRARTMASMLLPRPEMRMTRDFMGSLRAAPVRGAAGVGAAELPPLKSGLLHRRRAMAQPADEHGQQGEGNDPQDDRAQVVAYQRQVSEEIAPQAQGQDPGAPSKEIEDHKPGIGHPRQI